MVVYEDFDGLKEQLKANAIPIKELFQLARHHNRFVRLLVAKHGLGHEGLLTFLAEDSHWSIRYAVASRADVPKVLLKEKLCFDSDARVRQAVDENMLLTQEEHKEIHHRRVSKAYHGDFHSLRR